VQSSNSLLSLCLSILLEFLQVVRYYSVTTSSTSAPFTKSCTLSLLCLVPVHSSQLVALCHLHFFCQRTLREKLHSSIIAPCASALFTNSCTQPSSHHLPVHSLQIVALCHFHTLRQRTPRQYPLLSIVASCASTLLANTCPSL
jgi:hypothetical protein